MPSVMRCMGFAVALLLTSAFSFAQTQTERFDIDRFNIEGNTLLKPDEIEAVLKPFTGKHREYGDVQRAIEALGQRYRTEGFSVVWVVAPEQDLDRGVVTLRVIEARIGKVTLSGNRFFDDSNIRSSLPALREEVSPSARDISANVQLANENPAKQVDVVLRPGEKQGCGRCSAVTISTSAPCSARVRAAIGPVTGRFAGPRATRCALAHIGGTCAGALASHECASA